MSENCNQNCNSCSEDCAERKEQKTDFSEKLHEMSSIKKVIGVVSGKGGVGKSLVTSMLAIILPFLMQILQDLLFQRHSEFGEKPLVANLAYSLLKQRLALILCLLIYF